MLVSRDEVLSSGILDFEVFPLSEDAYFHCRGKNGKKLFIAFSGEENPALRQFLEKILTAVQHDLEADCLYFSTSQKQPFHFTELGKRWDLQQGIFFGFTPAQAGFNFQAQPYQVVRLSGKTYLFADDLAKIQADAGLKKLLWEGMKGMFER